jgi:glycosyltransferase involved in cell wall biosynthesis
VRSGSPHVALIRFVARSIPVRVQRELTRLFPKAASRAQSIARERRPLVGELSFRPLGRVPYANPWLVPFHERRRRLLSGSPRIAYYYPEPDSSTFRYRVFNMVEALEYAEPSASAAWLTSQDGSEAFEVIDDVDILVICRTLYEPHVAALITRAKALGKRVLFDIDDLIFDTRYAQIVMASIDLPITEKTLRNWVGKIERCGATLRLCDGAITTNDFLAERIVEFADTPVWVIPNFLNNAQLDISAEARRSRDALERTEDIRLGYFSGSATHNRDFALAEPAVARLLAADPRVSLRIVGFAPSSEHLARFAQRVEILPLMDFVNLQLALAEVDINLAPLQENVFTNCKSDLKYSEAAAVGTATIASPVHAFSRSISHGVNGFLASAVDWYDILVEQAERIHDLPKIAEAAVADALERYTPKAQAAAIRHALLR